MTPPPGLILFDCDGVLVDSEPIAMRILLETIAEAGHPLDPETGHSRLLGRSLATMREELAADFGVLLDDAALASMRERLYAAFRAELRPIAGIAETLDALAMPYCVASSSQPERIALSLGLTGLRERFEGRMFSATMVAAGKPAPDLFLHAAAVMGTEPARCLVVEDSPAGITAGRAAGMHVVAFLGGGHAGSPAHRQAVAAAGPHATVATMAELRAHIGGRG